MIEWPERIADLLPEDRLWIELRYINETRRGLRIQAFGDRPADLAQGVSPQRLRRMTDTDDCDISLLITLY